MKPPTSGVPKAAEKQAWARYLRTTRRLTDLEYEEKEPLAWAKLVSTLIDAKTLAKKRTSQEIATFTPAPTQGVPYS